MAQSRYADLLRQRRFLSLSIAMVVDNAASWAFNTVFAVVVFERTGSVTWISIAVAARWFPALIAGPFAGVVGDRYDRVRVLCTSAAASGVVMAVLAVLVAVEAPVLLLVAVSAAQALCATPYEPAVQGLVPDLLPERLLAAANGFLEVLRNLAVVIGPALGALFLVAGAPAGAVAVNAVSYLLPLVVALRLGVRSSGAGSRADDGADDGPGVFRQIGQGVAALRAEPTAFTLVLAAVVDTAIMGVITVLAVPISIEVGTGSQDYGYLLVASALGSVLAAGVATRLAARRALAPVIVGSLVLQALPLLLILAVPQPWSAAVALLISGAAMLVVDILAVTALQRDLPREYLSRVFAILDTLLFTALIAVTAVAGPATEAAGLDAVLWAVGLGVPVLVLLGLPALRASDRRTAAVAAALAPVVDLLDQLALFDGADRPALERVAACAQRVELPAGESLLREGEPADDLWLLAEGRLAIHSATAGDLPDVAAPGFVGELGLLHETPRTASVVTVAPCTLYRVPGSDFLAAVSSHAASSSLQRVSGVRLARTPAAA